jgi:hypothetical protein
MELIAVLALVLALNGIAHRWGFDSRDGCDWGCGPN